jgi:hypothetical protein
MVGDLRIRELLEVSQIDDLALFRRKDFKGSV